MPKNPISHGWSVTVLTVRGIPIRLHFTFLLFLGYVAFQESGVEGSVASRIGFVLAVFACVLLHEIGHALTARIFGIGTRDITLYPFGGVAYLMREGRPKEEFFVALAGPVVNLIIAVAIGFISAFTFESTWNFGSNFWGMLLLTNVFIAFFNLIPAYPMDGGRIFRAALALLGVKRATVYATRLSQILAVLMGLIALTTGNIILLVISALVFSHAVQELLRDRTISAAQGIRVREVMTDAPYLQSFTHGTTVSSAFAIALKSLQPAFAVLHSENVVGVLDREVLLSSAALEAEESYVAEHMNREFPIASPEDELATILDRFAGDDSRAIVVLLDSKFVGMVFRDRALEYLVVQGVRKKTKEQAAYLEEEW